MAFTDYTELQAFIVSDLYGRTDKTSEIQDAIRHAELEMSTHLRVREMDAIAASIVITDGVGTIPSELQTVNSVKLNVTPYTGLDYEPIELIEERNPTAGGTPCVFDIVGEEIVVWPPTSTTVKLRYRRDIPNLSDALATNWVIDKYPHLYTYGTLAFIYKHLKDAKRSNENMALFSAAIESLNKRSNRVIMSKVQVKPSVPAV